MVRFITNAGEEQAVRAAKLRNSSVGFWQQMV
jgi:hypothetical protein